MEQLQERSWHIVGIDNAKSVRRTISTIRSKFSHHSVECLTQQHITIDMELVMNNMI